MGHHRAWCYRTPCCQIAEAFGAHVIYYSASGQPAQNGYTQVDFDTLLTTSDIISVHAPLNEYTENLLDKRCICKDEKNPASF